MDQELKGRFTELWKKYFPGAEMPLALYYTDEPGHGERVPPAGQHRCVIGDLERARRGTPLSFDADAVVCGGGKRYLGFEEEIRPNFEYFLSCGIPGELEGERYKKTPQLVRELMKEQAPFRAPGKYIVFTQWEKMKREDDPAVVIFFASPDFLSGLFTLANFDQAHPFGVIAPFSSGCGSIVYYPYRELDSPHPRAVLGMFDVSARPCVAPDVLTLAIPWPRFIRMVDDMEESFLITRSWGLVRTRMQRRSSPHEA